MLLPTPCKEIRNILGLWIRRREFRLDSGFVVCGTGILDSGIDNPLAVLTGFQNKNSFIPDSTSKNFPDSGMRILLHVETFGKKYGLGKQN